MIVQDFSQLSEPRTQDLIIVLMFHDPDSETGIKHQYHHFVAESSDISNDIVFVICCWEILAGSILLDDYEQIDIWSDGGPKHFKISACMQYFSQLQTLRSTQKIVYNFFFAYHGHGICDTAASHAKRAMLLHEKNKQEPISNARKAVEIINNIPKHYSQLVTPTPEKIQVKTMQAIRTYHKFTFETPGQVNAYKLSKDKNISKTYVLEKKQVESTLNDMEVWTEDKTGGWLTMLAIKRKTFP